MKLLTLLSAAFMLSTASLTQASDLQIGSVAIYSNGQVKKLVEKSPQWTRWESARKRVYKQSLLPYLPTLEYQRFPPERGGYTRSVDMAKVSQLVPFGQSQDIAFTIRRTKSDGASSQRHWRCSYEGRGQQALMGREWRVDNYSCTRTNPFSKQPFRERREVSYAPDLGVVLKEAVTRRGGRSKVTRLEYLLAPKEASAERIADIVKDLRN